MSEENQDSALLTLTTDIVSAHVGKSSVAVGDIAGLIGYVHQALSGLGAASASPPPAEKPTPAVPVCASIKPDYLVCLEDGKKLKRHLMSHYQMTPGDYRAKWNLPSDYPMVAPNYAEKRRAFAHKIGLGKKAAAPKAKRGRKPAPKSPTD